MIKTAFVAGAGLGKRLRPLTQDRPKPLVPFFNRPLITYVFDALEAVGIERVVINTHYCASRYDDILSLTEGRGRYQTMQLECIHEPVLLETGGGIRNAAKLFGAEPVLVHNGDIFSSVDLEGLIRTHAKAGGEVTAHLRSFGGPLQVTFDRESGCIQDFRGTLAGEMGEECLFSGIYIVEPRFIERIPPDEIISVIPVFLDMLRSNIPIAGFLDDTGTWADLGTREAYLDAHAILSRDKQSPQIYVHPTAKVDASAELRGFVVIGANAEVGGHTIIEDSVIWENAKITSGAHLMRCIVRDHQIAAGQMKSQDI